VGVQKKTNFHAYTTTLLLFSQLVSEFDYFSII